MRFILKIIIFFVLISSLCKIIFFCSDSPQWHSFDGNAMTLDYHIMVNLNVKDQKKLNEIISSTFREIDCIYNKWNPDSEISKINQLKAHEIISISSELENFLSMTENIVKLSQGRFDPTIEPLQQLWKDHLKEGLIPCYADIQSILPAVGWHKLHFGQGKFFKDHNDTSLDLGAIAKGYCVDLLVERIMQVGYGDVFVEWGGEIRANGMNPQKQPWSIFIGRFDDVDARNAIAQINIHNQSVATSGDYLQNWSIYKDGSKSVFFHIIDPFTAKPLESTLSSVASATVLAPTCFLADALATVAMMHTSLADAKKWAEEINKNNPEIKFWLISREEQ